MARNLEIKKCKTCGTMLNPESRLDRILKGRNEALEKYYNKYIRRKKLSVGIVKMMLYGVAITPMRIMD